MCYIIMLDYYTQYFFVLFVFLLGHMKEAFMSHVLRVNNLYEMI